VDELSLVSEQKQRVSRSGQPMMSNSRAAFLYALRRFVDYELWGWGRLKLAPTAIWSRRTPSFQPGSESAGD
jgi:hypothetical protein